MKLTKFVLTVLTFHDGACPQFDNGVSVEFQTDV